MAQTYETPNSPRDGYIEFHRCLPTFASFLAGLLLLSGCGFPKTVSSPPAPLTEGEVALAKARSPQTNADSLKSGHTQYVAKCNGCHGYPDLASIPDDKWPEIMKRMAKKSDLSTEQESQVLAFILTAKNRK